MMPRSLQRQLERRQLARTRGQLTGRLRDLDAKIEQERAALADAAVGVELERARSGAAACLADAQAAPGYSERRSECGKAHELRCAGWRPIPSGDWRSPAGLTLPLHEAARRVRA